MYSLKLWFGPVVEPQDLRFMIHFHCHCFRALVPEKNWKFTTSTRKSSFTEEKTSNMSTGNLRISTLQISASQEDLQCHLRFRTQSSWRTWRISWPWRLCTELLGDSVESSFFNAFCGMSLNLFPIISNLNHLQNHSKNTSSSQKHK